MTAKIALGFELKTGAPITVPPDRHAICVGLTQQSGKSTTLEAMANKISGRAVAFITKPGEHAFESGEQIPPFFLEPQLSDEIPMWRFVLALIEAKLNQDIEGEKKRLMTVCRGARSLKQVYENAKREFAAKRTGHTYIAILEYLEMVIPEIERIGATKKLKLHKGLNVMDLRAVSDGMKNLVIASVIRWIHQHEKNVTVIIPEAWKIVPAGRNSPVLLAAVPLIREGAASGNYFWLDAQDLASVHIEMRRSVSLFLIGRQTQEREIERGISALIPEPARPQPSELMSLRIGDFFVGYDNFRSRIYVQPLWADSFAAKNYAMSRAPMPQAPQRPPARPTFTPFIPMSPGEPMPFIGGAEHIDTPILDASVEAAKKLATEPDPEKLSLRHENETLRADVARLTAQLAERTSDPAAVRLHANETENGVRVPPRPPTPISSPVQVKTKANGEQWENVDIDALLDRIRARAAERPEIMQVFVTRPELQVVTERKTLRVEGDSVRGGIALLIHDGFFNEERNGNQIYSELLRRGRKLASIDGRFYNEISDVAEMGFLTVRTAGNRTKWFQAVPGMIVEKSEETK